MKVEKLQQCRLLPYKRHDITSTQNLKEKLGWGISRFKISEVWGETKGEGTVVAVIDTGVDLNHSDLKDNLIDGYNFLKPGTDPEDDGEHGTHVTGIICAKQNKLGIVGVAPDAKVRPIKVLSGDGDGDVATVVKGIRWAIKQKVDFISLSLGTYKPNSSLRWALKAAAKAGIVTFAAAGNTGKSKQLLYPANYNETISVGAIDQDLKRANFSCTGDNLDFMAPGVDILSTVPKNWWAILSGSSMAQPFVCGLACLLLSYSRQHPEKKIKLNNIEDYKTFFKKYTINVIGENCEGDIFYQGLGIITAEGLV